MPMYLGLSKRLWRFSDAFLPNFYHSEQITRVLVLLLTLAVILTMEPARVNGQRFNDYRNIPPVEEEGYWEKKSCYSCMSSAYAPFWEALQVTYFRPMNFTNSCDEKFSAYNMGTIQCTGPCITMMEGLSIAGQDVGPAYIRGCFNKILKAGFNNSAVTTHRIRYMERCIVVDRQQLFNGKTNQGHVRICGCLSDRCNGSNGLSMGSLRAVGIWPTLVVLLLLLTGASYCLLSVGS